MRYTWRHISPKSAMLFMLTPANYRVITTGNLIKADIEGLWDAASDVGYLTQLSEAMRQLRNKPWALVVDMRGWVVTEQMRNFKQTNIAYLDRRNQKLECWIVDDYAQGSHLFHYVEHSDILFKRCLTVDAANSWLSQYGFSL